MPFNGYLKLNPEALKSFCIQILKKVHVPCQDAEIVADTLLQADLRGNNSHGIIRLPIYIKRILLGLVNPKPNMEIIKESVNTALYDGDFGLGQVSSFNAMKIAIDKAELNKIGAVGVRNSSHLGATAYYAMMALPQDMIGFACSNTPPLMPAPGGTKAVIGNNPFAFAVPAGEELPIVLDMACSIAAQGKIILAMNKGEKIPEGWAANSQGLPTTDPLEALEGLLLPVGGPKGYGLAIIVDIFAGLLTGGAFGSGVASIYKDLQNKQKNGHFFMALKISSFMEPFLFKKRIDNLIQQIKQGPLAPGVQEIFLPGEIAFKTAERNIKEGLTLSTSIMDEITKMAEEIGADRPTFT
jgi:ureidoglycolate dehydrogenase (NAD+)